MSVSSITSLSGDGSAMSLQRAVLAHPTAQFGSSGAADKASDGSRPPPPNSAGAGGTAGPPPGQSNSSGALSSMFQSADLENDTNGDGVVSAAEEASANTDSSSQFLSLFAVDTDDASATFG